MIAISWMDGFYNGKWYCIVLYLIKIQWNPAITDPRVVENLTIADFGSVP